MPLIITGIIIASQKGFHLSGKQEISIGINGKPAPYNGIETGKDDKIEKAVADDYRMNHSSAGGIGRIHCIRHQVSRCGKENPGEPR